MLRAAIGFRVHSGWAMLVAAAGSPAKPDVLLRRRIQIAEHAIPGSTQPYHYAKELGIEKAQAYPDGCSEASLVLARQALARALEDLNGFKVIGCAMLMSSGRTGTNLESILKSHPAIHAAEGDFFRSAMAGAIASHGLSCQGIREKELSARVTAAFGFAI